MAEGHATASICEQIHLIMEVLAVGHVMPDRKRPRPPFPMILKGITAQYKASGSWKFRRWGSRLARDHAGAARRAQLATARGVPYLQVDASSDSAPILRRLGFQPLTTTTPYVWTPPAPLP